MMRGCPGQQARLGGPDGAGARVHGAVVEVRGCRAVPQPSRREGGASATNQEIYVHFQTGGNQIKPKTVFITRIPFFDLVNIFRDLDRPDDIRSEFA